MINFVYRNRVKLGLPTFFAGIGSLTGGVIVAHYAGFPQGEIVDYFNWIPRGWLPQTIGQFIAFSGSQLILIGLVLMAWSDKPLTWSKAAYFSFLGLFFPKFFFHLINKNKLFSLHSPAFFKILKDLMLEQI